MTRSIVICEYISTGLNYIDDVRARGYEPVLVEGTYVGPPEDQAPLRAMRDSINKHQRHADIKEVMKAGNCSGATLVFSDTLKDVEGADVVNSDSLSDAYDSYEFGILDISDERSFADLESLVQQIFTFVGKIRRGGRILVPESTYVHLPYQMEGMEILLRVPGLRIEMPISDMVSLLVASVE